MKAQLLIPIIAFFGTSYSAAAEIETIEVVKRSGYYTLVSTSKLKAPVNRVYDVLVDYENIPRISSAFREGRYIEQDDNGNGIVYSLMRGCVAFFCHTLERTELLTVKPNVHIVAEAIPEKSDVKYAHSEWHLRELDRGTLIDFRLTFKPKFWVPPLLGTWAIKRSLKRDGEEAIQRIEKIAINPAVILDTDRKIVQRKSKNK